MKPFSVRFAITDEVMARLFINSNFRNEGIAAIEKLGFTNATELFKTYPNYTATQIAQHLNGGLRGLIIESLYLCEANAAGLLQSVSKDLLFRDLVNEHPSLVVLSLWASKIDRITGDEFRSQVLSKILHDVIEYDKSMVNWKPKSCDDEYLTLLFNKYWPSGTIVAEKPEVNKETRRPSHE